MRWRTFKLDLCALLNRIYKDNHLTIPILDGKDEISNAANKWADAAANAFNKHFEGETITENIGWNCKYNDAAIKVILYHEVLTQIAQILDESGILPIPEVLTTEIPANKKQTANVGYITARK